MKIQEMDKTKIITQSPVTHQHHGPLTRKEQNASLSTLMQPPRLSLGYSGGNRESVLMGNFASAS